MMTVQTDNDNSVHTKKQCAWNGSRISTTMKLGTKKTVQL